MTDAADIRRAVERCGLLGFARRAGCPAPAVQRLVKRGAYPERGPHGEAMRAAVAEVPAESEAAGPEPGATPESEPECGPVPEYYAETLRFLCTPAMAAEEAPDMLTVGVALGKLARDCGYRLEALSLEPLDTPALP